VEKIFSWFTDENSGLLWDPRVVYMLFYITQESEETAKVVAVVLTLMHTKTMYNLEN
jgi:hypothetical protein